MKPFGYPIALDHLALFRDPDGTPVVTWEGLTYYRTEWWTLRTTQAHDAPQATASPITPELAQQFATIPAKEDASWRPLDDIARLVNKFPARIWERTQFRHHLQSYPLVLIAHYLLQRGILQLCTRLPAAHIHTGYIMPQPVIRFKGGEIILHTLPTDWRDKKPSLTFYQPKHSPL